MSLLPKNQTFWRFFTDQTSALSAASGLLAEAANLGNSSLVGAAVRIKAIEQESAQTLRNLQFKLHRTFITPIDAEDISLLSEQLDRLLDEIEAISYRMAAYKLDGPRSNMAVLAERIHESAELIENAFERLSRGDAIEDDCSKVLAMEENTDRAIRDAVARLFEEEKDLISLLKQKEILDFFERLSNSMRDLANSMQNVSIKNS